MSDALPLRAFPHRIRYGVACRHAFNQGEDGRTVGGPFKGLQVGQVVYRLHPELLTLFPQPEAAEAVSSAFSLENGLGDDKSELAFGFEVVVGTGIGEQHREVFLPSAEPRGVPLKGE